MLGPASRSEDLVVPRREQQVLQRLHNADIDFPLIYVAHEVTKEQTKELEPAAGQSHTVLNHEKASQIIGPVPAPAETVALGDKLEHRSKQLLRAARRTAAAGGALAAGIAAAPVILVGGALAGLAQLDPIILGALPAHRAREGEPAAWFILARWDW